MRAKNGLSYFICAALFAAAACGCMSARPAFGEEFIVKDGRPGAEIIISGKPARMAKLAAEELQAYVEIISGARLAITNEAGKDIPVKIYVVKSKYTDQLKITDEGLKHGELIVK